MGSLRHWWTNIISQKSCCIIAGIILMIAFGQIQDSPLLCDMDTGNSGKGGSMTVTYYLDSDSGDDKNNGTSPEQAWESLNHVNGVIFKPGDRILFKAGTRYSGQLKPQGSGQQEKPIIIDMYGEGDRPRIDGEGAVRQTLYLYNVEYWEISNLEITNKGKDRQPRRKGVFVHIEDFGTAHHIHLKNLYIHDVNGGLVKRKGAGSGISWRNEGREKKSRFDDLLIEGCHIVRCERNGITGGGYWGRDQWYPSLNVVIRKNLLEQVPGDGIVPIACDGALVEYNIMRDCTRLLPDGDAAAGIWPWSCDNTVVQFNEVSDHKAPWDAQGFDSDWNCRNTIIQYNYSHDNEGGFLLICNNGKTKMPKSIGNEGTIVRYNISVNDGLRASGKHAGFSPTFHISGPCKNTKIYNNVIYVRKKPDDKIDKKLLKMDNWGGPWPENTWFANNIFYAENMVRWNFGKAINTVFENNLYYGIHKNRPQDASAISIDPLFVNPGGDAPSNYRTREGSPCIDAGMDIPDNGGHDFSGADIKTNGRTNIGAFE